MSDPRLGERLWAALAALPRGAGILLRHDGEPGRLALGARVRARARRRGLAFVVAGEPRMARRLRADGLHRREAGMRPGWPVLRGGAGGKTPRGGWRTASAHGVAGLVAARRARADLVFLGPVFATASHPGAMPLGPVRTGLMLRSARLGRAGAPGVALLGGMDARRARRLGQRLGRLGVVAWGAIDALAAAGRPAANPPG